MATPIGHSLLGLAVGISYPSASYRNLVAWYIYVVFAANAADLDFLPGLLIGDMNRYHHLATHSFTAAIVFAILTGLVAGRFNLRPIVFGFSSGLIYASHLLADYITADLSAPVGMPLLWPLADDFYISPVILLQNVQHGEFGDTTGVIMRSIFSLHNVFTVAIELVIFLPIFVLALFRRRLLQRRTKY